MLSRVGLTPHVGDTPRGIESSRISPCACLAPHRSVGKMQAVAVELGNAADADQRPHAVEFLAQYAISQRGCC